MVNLNLKEFDIEATKHEGLKKSRNIGDAGEFRRVFATIMRDWNIEKVAEWIKRSAYKK